MTLLPRAIVLTMALSFAITPTISAQPPAAPPAPPVRLAIAGVSHGHIGRIVRLIKASPDVELVGVFDADRALHELMAKRHGLSASLFFDDLAAMLESTRPQAVAAFGTTFDHPAVVEAAAARGIHVMMEKPLAVSMADAERIRVAATRGQVHVIVNYETTWYPSLAATWELMKTRKAGGDIRKMVAMHGHQGPREIGVGDEFFDWLTDPVRNGAGALFDFGCYGANIMTWLMDDERPLSVTAITQQIKPAIYPRVDDEATILVSIHGRRASSRRRGTGRSTGRTSRPTVPPATPSRPAAMGSACASRRSPSRVKHRRRCRRPSATSWPTSSASCGGRRHRRGCRRSRTT
jgi:predicted dehydrogenase